MSILLDASGAVYSPSRDWFRVAIENFRAATVVFEDGIDAHRDQNRTVLADSRQKNSKVRTGVGGWNRWRYEFIRLYPFGVAPKPA